jgi:hypothetical protein
VSRSLCAAASLAFAASYETEAFVDLDLSARASLLNFAAGCARANILPCAALCTSLVQQMKDRGLQHATEPRLLLDDLQQIYLKFLVVRALEARAGRAYAQSPPLVSVHSPWLAQTTSVPRPILLFHNVLESACPAALVAAHEFLGVDTTRCAPLQIGGVSESVPCTAKFRALFGECVPRDVTELRGYGHPRWLCSMATADSQDTDDDSAPSSQASVGSEMSATSDGTVVGCVVS